MTVPKTQFGKCPENLSEFPELGSLINSVICSFPENINMVTQDYSRGELPQGLAFPGMLFEITVTTLAVLVSVFRVYLTVSLLSTYLHFDA